MLRLYTMYQNLKYNLANKEEGQGLVEYALIIVLIALVVLAGLNPVADALNVAFERISTELTPATT